MRSQPSPPRSRTRGQRTATGPMPVMISRSGRCPWRTNRRRPSSVSLSAWQLSKLETSASTACARSARAPLRKTSVSGSVKVPGCESWKTLVSVTAYHSFAGEVEASNTPTIRRLTPSRRHQLSPIAHGSAEDQAWNRWHSADVCLRPEREQDRCRGVERHCVERHRVECGAVGGGGGSGSGVEPAALFPEGRWRGRGLDRQWLREVVLD